MNHEDTRSSHDKANPISFFDRSFVPGGFVRLFAGTGPYACSPDGARHERSRNDRATHNDGLTHDDDPAHCHPPAPKHEGNRWSGGRQHKCPGD